VERRLPQHEEQLDRTVPVGAQRLGDDRPQQRDRLGGGTGAQLHQRPQRGEVQRYPVRVGPFGQLQQCPGAYRVPALPPRGRRRHGAPAAI